jgi:hypothetical protein
VSTADLRGYVGLILDDTRGAMPRSIPLETPVFLISGHGDADLRQITTAWGAFQA